MGENLYRLFFVRYKKIKSLNRRDAEAQRKTLLFVNSAAGAINKIKLCASASLR